MTSVSFFIKSRDTQDMIRSLEKEATSAGLNINCGKTKMLSLTGGANITIEVAGRPFYIYW